MYITSLCVFCFLLPFAVSYTTDIPRTGQRVVMQSLNCLSFLLVATILSATLEPFVTIAHRGLKMAADTENGPETKLELTVVDRTSLGEGIGNNVVTRRKLVSGDAGMDKTEAKDARSIPISGAKHPVRKCVHGGRKDSSMNCYFRSRKLPPGAYFDGHIPFTADYPKPQHHLPKNN